MCICWFSCVSTWFSCAFTCVLERKRVEGAGLCGAASARLSTRGRASCGPSFFVAGGGREGHWSGVRAYFYIPKKRLLQSTLCGYSRSIAHISVWACLACVPDAEARGSIEERRGCPDALGARGRPFLLRAVPWVSLRAILVSALSIKSHAASPRRARHFWTQWTQLDSAAFRAVTHSLSPK